MQGYFQSKTDRKNKNIQPGLKKQHSYEKERIRYTYSKEGQGVWMSTGGAVEMRSPPTSVVYSRAQHLMWVEDVVGSHPAPKDFLRVLWFSSLYKNQHL